MGKPRKALILGVTGQDGALLASHLLESGWEVWGGFRRGNQTKLWRLEELEILDRVHLVDISVNDIANLISVFRVFAPDHIYHFAGASFVADSFDNPRSVIEINTLGALTVLDAARLAAPEARLFFASSSEIFGRAQERVTVNEASATAPSNPYGASKLAAQHLFEIYRDYHDLYAVTGILFNHESEFRARNFVTRKITFHMARLKAEGGPPIQLGSLDAARDWGSARDYVTLMPKLLEQPNPQNYVVATGKATTVREFLACSASSVGFDPEFEGQEADERCIDRKSGLVLAEVSEKYFRRLDTACHLGDSARLVSTLGDCRLSKIEDLAAEMTRVDLQRRAAGRTYV